MGRTGPFRMATAVALAFAATPSGGAAQCRLCETPSTVSGTGEAGAPVGLEIEAALDFDRIILLSSNADGTATLLPDGTRAVSGAVAAMGGRAMVGTAIVKGEGGRAVRVDLPRRIELYSVSGGRIVLDEIVSDLPRLPRLNASGTLAFRFGGRLRIAGDADGEYRGDLPITVEYF